MPLIDAWQNEQVNSKHKKTHKRRKKMHKNQFVILGTLIAASLVLAACGAPAIAAPVQALAEATAPTAPTAAPATEAPIAEPTDDPLAMYLPAAVTGDIVSAGSSTVFPLSERMAERFKEEGYAGNITIDSIGSGAGFERFCKAGETDIANASRKIKDSEKESCAALANPRTPLQFRVGTDALAIVVSSSNDFAKDVTIEELAAIYSTAAKWSDVRPEWPAEPIQRFSPGTDSGTFDYFVEFVMAPANKNTDGKADIKLGEDAILKAANIQFSEDDNVLVQGVEGSPYAIGYFGFAYFQENKGKLQAMTVGGIAPDEKTAEDGSYKLSRPLFIYGDAKIMKDKPQVAAFIHFYLMEVNNEILSVGYFPASQALLDEALATWESALK
jgi:phosphate transport system substrate-binding protein